MRSVNLVPASSSATATALRDRVAAGERGALGEAFESYQLFAMKLLHERRRNPSDLDDLVQDAFMLLPRCARRCSPETTLGGCVATAVFQAIRGFDNRAATSDQTQHGKPTRRVELKPVELAQVPDGAWTPEEALELRERVHHLSELLQLMPSRQREILIAREVNGLTPTEIAEIFSIRPGTVAAFTMRARKTIEQLAAKSPLAEVFAAMPKRLPGMILGSSRSARWRRRKAAERKTG